MDLSLKKGSREYMNMLVICSSVDMYGGESKAGRRHRTSGSGKASKGKNEPQRRVRFKRRFLPGERPAKRNEWSTWRLRSRPTRYFREVAGEALRLQLHVVNFNNETM